MIRREILGYCIFFKKEADAEKLFKQIPKVFEAEYNKAEKEIMILDCLSVKKEDFHYVFEKNGETIEVEPNKVEFVQTLFART